jgi:fumarate reductase iron-sulfur subunit
MAINKIPRVCLDRRSAADDYEMVGGDSGGFGCMSLLGCHHVCPKALPLQTQIAFNRRKTVAEGMK